MSGLASGIFCNEGERIVKHTATMLLLPAALSALPQLTQRLVLTVQPGWSDDRVGMIVLSVFVAAVLWLAFFGLCSIVARLVGPWSLPSGLHNVVCKMLSVAFCALAFVGLAIALRVADAHLLHLSSAYKAFATVAMTVLFALSLRRMFKTRAPLPKPVSSGKRSAVSGLRLADRPKTTFDDVAGMQDVKDQIRLRLIEPVRNPARAKQYGLKAGGGMLLYGPPGTGKTLLARAVAGELDLPFYTITAADVFGKHVGESERNIRNIFADIRKNRLAVVFIDELETLFPSRSNDVHETTRKVISFLLQELDGIDQNKNPILLIGATNVPWMVDEAFLRPGRFDVKTFVGLPDADARCGILTKAFAKGTVPHESGLPDYMANATSNYSGADLNGVMNRLRQMAYDRRAPRYTRPLADEAIVLTSPTACGEILERIRAWERGMLGGEGER